MNVVFDIGGVLIDWDPHLAFEEALGSRQAAAEFLARTDFMSLNARADAGELFSALSAEIPDAADRALFQSYVGSFGKAVPNAIEGTWDIVAQLQTRGTPLHAITNWSAETWTAGVAQHPRLQSAFATVVVSGSEKMIKPDARIYETLCTRAQIHAEDCVFIDDSPKNVAGAREVGMDAIHFTSPDALASELRTRNLL